MKGRIAAPGPVQDEAPSTPYSAVWLLLYLLFFALVFLPIIAG